MTKVFTIICWLWAATSISFGQSECDGQGRIEGTVVDNRSIAVAGATVTVLPEQCTITGIAPSATTDSEGRFLLTGVPVGETGVYAQKPDAGYPDMTAAIYVDDDAPPPHVSIKAGQTVSGLTVKLGKQATFCSGTVLDADTSKALITARIKISLPSNERIMLSIGTDQNGRFHLLLPLRPIKFTVSAPGYEEWQWTTANQTQPGVFQPTALTLPEATIKLHKLKE